MNTYSVHFVEDAERDITDIVSYIFEHDSPESAEYVLEELEKTCRSVARLPGREHVPPELERVGIMDYREVHFKPYRVIYPIEKGRVCVHCILEGRQDAQAVLERRLLR